MIVNSEKMKMEKSYPILVSATDFLSKFLPLPKFFETLSSPLKKSGREQTTNVFSSKNLFNII